MIIVISVELGFNPSDTVHVSAQACVGMFGGRLGGGVGKYGE